MILILSEKNKIILMASEIKFNYVKSKMRRLGEARKILFDSSESRICFLICCEAEKNH